MTSLPVWPQHYADFYVKVLEKLQSEVREWGARPAGRGTHAHMGHAWVGAPVGAWHGQAWMGAVLRRGATCEQRSCGCSS
jgi:hypothetical protein